MGLSRKAESAPPRGRRLALAAPSLHSAYAGALLTPPPSYRPSFHASSGSFLNLLPKLVFEMKPNLPDAVMPLSTVVSAWRELASIPAYWKKVREVNLTGIDPVRLPYGPHPRQYVLVVKPRGPMRGTVVYFHGGGWKFSSPERFLAAAQVLSEHGWATILPSYRRIPRYSYPQILDDAVTGTNLALRWLHQAHGAHLPWFLGGMSAGGHLAAALALEKRQGQFWSTGHPPLGVFSCGGVLDFDYLPPSPVLLALAGRRHSATYLRANPKDQLLAHPAAVAPPPFLLVHGTLDGLAPYANALSFARTYTSHFLVDQLSWQVLPEGSHLDAGYWMFEDNAARRAILSFLERQLATPVPTPTWEWADPTPGVRPG